MIIIIIIHNCIYTYWIEKNSQVTNIILKKNRTQKNRKNKHHCKSINSLAPFRIKKTLWIDIRFEFSSLYYARIKFHFSFLHYIGDLPVSFYLKKRFLEHVIFGSSIDIKYIRILLTIYIIIILYIMFV